MALDASFSVRLSNEYDRSYFKFSVLLFFISPRTLSVLVHLGCNIIHSCEPATMADSNGPDSAPSPSYEHSSTLLPAITPTASTLAISPALITHSPSLQMDRRASPTTSCSINEVVVEISTAVLIPDYSMYFSEPIQQFRPTYYALPDGSLVAPPYLNDVQQGNWIILFTGALLMLFVRNSIVSADYIRRGRVKYKGLFYALLISQLLGVLSFVIMAASFLARQISCTAYALLFPHIRIM